MSLMRSPTLTPRARAPRVMRMLLIFRGVVSVKSTNPRSGERSRALRVSGPPNSQPGRSFPIRPSSRASWNVMPSLTCPTPSPVIFLAAMRAVGPLSAEAPMATAPVRTSAVVNASVRRMRRP